VTLAMVIAALGTLNSSILSGARVPYAMARDGIFFRGTAEIHARFRTPGGAILFEFVISSIFALTGTFEELTSLFLFATWIFYALAVAAMIRMRRSEPGLVRPYRCWGYPWVPAAFLAGAAALTVTLWLARPIRSSIGLALIFSGLIFYQHWQRRLPVHS
jgi:APA family basic amino acid/polyamine antiporter